MQDVGVGVQDTDKTDQLIGIDKRLVSAFAWAPEDFDRFRATL